MVPLSRCVNHSLAFLMYILYLQTSYIPMAWKRVGAGVAFHDRINLLLGY